MNTDVMASTERRIQELEAEVEELREMLATERRTVELAVGEMNHLRMYEFKVNHQACQAVNDGLKAALDQNGRKYDEIQAQLQQLLDKEDGYRLHIANLSIINRDLRTPCRCDPPGSGEEFCNSTCMIRDTLGRLMDESGRVSHGNTNVLELFDAAVALVRGEKT